MLLSVSVILLLHHQMSCPKLNVLLKIKIRFTDLNYRDIQTIIQYKYKDLPLILTCHFLAEGASPNAHGKHACVY